MSTAEKILARMRRNPRDWTLDSLLTVARRFNLTVRNPRGSHVIFSFPGVFMEACVPAHRPIKPVYVTKFLALLDAAAPKED